MTREIVAVVESPTQLLHVLEWAHVHDCAAQMVAVVLAPTWPASLSQLRSMLIHLEEEDIALAWHEPTESPTAPLRTLRAVAPVVAKARRLLIGDPFSPMTQALLLTAHPREVVVVDDGTATMEFADQINTRQPLQRGDGPSAGGGVGLVRGPLADHARRFFQTERMSLFSVLPITGLPPSRVQSHSYDWTRRRFAQPQVISGADLVGSLLVESGLASRLGYLEAVATLIAHARITRYLAHPHEAETKLNQLAELGLSIVRPSMPIEVEVRRGPVARRVISFPSASGYTLPLVLHGTGVRCEPQAVPDSLYLPDVTVAARRLVERVSADLARLAATTGPVAFPQS